MVAALALAACATAPADEEPARPDAFASTYTPRPSVPTLIRNGTVFDGNGAELANADVLMRDGRIVAVGQNLNADGATVIDATGRFVTPGIIDAHSHLGVYPSPSIDATSDGNEATDPNTAQVWAEHSVWPQDPGFQRAVAGGITTLHILPGSANNASAFQLRTIVAIELGDKSITSGVIVDMSIGGALMMSRSPDIAKDMRPMIKFKIDVGTVEYLMELQAQICSVRASEEDADLGQAFGIRFVDVSPEDNLVLSAFVFQRLADNQLS